MNHPEDDDHLADALARGPRIPAVRPGAGSMIMDAAVRSRRRRSMIQAGAAFGAVVVLAAGITLATNTSQRQAPPVIAPPVLTSSTAVSSGPPVPSAPPPSTLPRSTVPVSTVPVSTVPVSTVPPTGTPAAAAPKIQTFAEGTRMTFGSQDGKIRCASADLRGLLVHCQTDKAAATLPGPEPELCGDLGGSVAWGRDVAILPGSWAAFTCDADTLDAPTQKLAAGDALRVGDVTCTAKSASEIECGTPSVGKAGGATIALKDGRTVSAQPGNTFGKLDIDPAGREFQTGFLTRLDSISLSFRPAYHYASRVGNDGYQLWWLPNMTANEKSDRSFVDTEFFACCGLGLDGISYGTHEGPDDYGTLSRNAQDVIRQMQQGSLGSPVLITQRRRGGEGAQYGVERVFERFTTDPNTTTIRAATGG